VNRSKSVRTTEFWRRRGKRKYNQGPKPGTCRIAYAVARAHRWFDEISTGKARSLAEIAACEGLAVRYVGRLIRLGLAPVIIESIVEGRQPISPTAEAVTRHIELPLRMAVAESRSEHSVTRAARTIAPLAFAILVEFPVRNCAVMLFSPLAISAVLYHA
jgi:hypothetical protein